MQFKNRRKWKQISSDALCERYVDIEAFRQGCTADKKCAPVQSKMCIENLCDEVLVYVKPQLSIRHTRQSMHNFLQFLEHNLKPALQRKPIHFLLKKIFHRIPKIVPSFCKITYGPASSELDVYNHWGQEMLFHSPRLANLSSYDFDLIPKMNPFGISNSELFSRLYKQ